MKQVYKLLVSQRVLGEIFIVIMKIDFSNWGTVDR